jgi:hypothetical protein
LAVALARYSLPPRRLAVTDSTRWKAFRTPIANFIHLSPTASSLSTVEHCPRPSGSSLPAPSPVPALPETHPLPREQTTNMASSSSNVVGVHYRVGKKIGEGSFGVIFEGTNLLNNQQVAIKFVRGLIDRR